MLSVNQLQEEMKQNHEDMKQKHEDIMAAIKQSTAKIC
jgi:hypothetical protein